MWYYNIMKIKIISILFVLIVFICKVSAEETQPGSQPNALPKPPQPPVVTAQNIPFENCTRMFTGVSKENLFMLTLSAISTNKYSVEEIQTKDGYIIFTALKNKYLATVSGIDNNNSILKITPCNDIYFFQASILSNIFKYIEANKVK